MCNGTHRKETVHTSEQQCKSTGSVQYLLETTTADVPRVPLPSANNDLDVYLCGEDTFSHIAQDIQSARHSIDIICWGFDPGMMLVRPNGQWDNTQTFGHLLEQAAQRDVKVRLLGWYSFIGNKVQHNQPGRGELTTEDKDAWKKERFPSLETPKNKTAAQIRHDYNAAWFQRHTNRISGNLEFRDRSGQSGKANAALKTETSCPDATETLLLEYFATHHQKTLLIDYAAPDTGTGYIMGLNALTDYWDSHEHKLNNPRRETNDNSKERQHGWYSKKTFRDYACRLTGGNILYKLHDNFASAWQRAGGTPYTPPQASPRFKAQHPVRAQLLRTQPEENERTIKALYHHLYTAAQHYLYIENQYFFYYEWVQLLLHYRASFVKQWRACHPQSTNPAVKQRIRASDLPSLHLIIVTPEPEHAEQIPRTYDCLRELGMEALLRGKKTRVVNGIDEEYGLELGQDVYIATGQIAGERQRPDNRMLASRGIQPPNDVVRDARKIPHRSATYMEKVYGLKVSVAMLYTGGQVKGLYDFRDIYIHSKLIIADDMCFSLGSANLGQRSMATDSELNIAVNDPGKAAKLRQTVFKNLTADQVTGVDGQAAAFQAWTTLMKKNAVQRKNHKPMTGFLLPFKELRESATRFA